MIKTKRLSLCPHCMGMGVIFEKTVYDALVKSARQLAEYSVEENGSDFQQAFEEFQDVIGDIEDPKRNS
jgi:hypothetical protein